MFYSRTNRSQTTGRQGINYNLFQQRIIFSLKQKLLFVYLLYTPIGIVFISVFGIQVFFFIIIEERECFYQS